MKSLAIDKVTTDASEKLVGRKLNEGLNHLDTHDSGMELHVRAEEGELLEYVIRHESGCPVEEETTITTVSKKKTTCWKCGKDQNGDIHCWQVPCPVIIGPWLPELVVQAGFHMAVAPMG